MLFSKLLPEARVGEMVDGYIKQCEGKLSQIAERTGPQSDGERASVLGLGQTIYTSMLDYLRAHRAEIECQAAQAAE